MKNENTNLKIQHSDGNHHKEVNGNVNFQEEKQRTEKVIVKEKCEEDEVCDEENGQEPRLSFLEEMDEARMKQERYDNEKYNNNKVEGNAHVPSAEMPEEVLDEEKQQENYCNDGEESPSRSIFLPIECPPLNDYSAPSSVGEPRSEEQQPQQNNRTNNNMWSIMWSNDDDDAISDSSKNQPEDGGEKFVQAIVVEKEDIEASVRRQIIEKAAKAEVIDTNSSEFFRDINNNDSINEDRRCRSITIIIMILLFALAGISIGVSLGNKNEKRISNTDSPTIHPSYQPSTLPTETILPRLDRIKEKNKLVCAIPTIGSPGLAEIDKKSGRLKGFNVDLCRAVAAAIFTSSNRSSITHIDGFIDYNHIGIYDFDRTEVDTDVLVQTITHTAQRDVIIGQTNLGYTFTVPYLYDGLRFGGMDLNLVQCADNVQAYYGLCKNLKICVCTTCTHIDQIRYMFPARVVVPSDDIAKSFEIGECNVIASELTLMTTIIKEISEDKFDNATTLKEYFIAGQNVFSGEPLAMVTRENDPIFSDFVNYVLMSLFEAEKQNITKQAIQEMRYSEKQSDKINSIAVHFGLVFGQEYDNMFHDIIGSVGNYKELYDRNLQDIIPRAKINDINTKGNTGLIFPWNFRGIGENGTQGLTKGGTLERIINRGHLRCGIIETGATRQMDIDYCHAISKSIFPDDTTKHVIVDFTHDRHGNSRSGGESRDYFVALVNETIDVLAGINVTLENDVREPTTQVGFSFSQPYFYHNASLGLPPIALVTTQDDPQFSDFVWWVIACTFYAEEESISQGESNYNAMPIVNLFGPRFQHMFQNIIKNVGNYGEIYGRTVETSFPRNNTNNMLNRIPYTPQHFSVL